MAKVALSYGHGSNTYEDKHGKGVISGGQVYEEHTHNYMVGEKVRKILEAHGVDVLVLQPPNGKDVPLETRTDRANEWGADLYYSIHSNAADPVAKGYCAFYWGTSPEGKKLAEAYANYAKAEGFPLYHNGSYASKAGTWNDFHELRRTEMVALLTENGFMTNKEDFKKIFLNEGDSWNKEARIHAKTILSYFKISYDASKGGEVRQPKESIISDDLYFVQVGAFASKKNAEALVAKLKKDGYPAIITR